MIDLTDKFVNGIYKCFSTGCYYVGVCREPVIVCAIVFYGHVHFPYVVAALVDGLYQEFFYKHVAAYYHLDSGYCRVNRTIA